MNIIKINSKIYKCEFCWRATKNQKIYDYNKKLFPYPPNKDVILPPWQNQVNFLNKLKLLELYLLKHDKFIKNDNPSSSTSRCIICDDINFDKLFELNNIRWPDNLYHYVEKHNLRPSDEFIDLVFRFESKNKSVNSEVTKKKISGSIYLVDKNKRYLKLDRNQILILDALLVHGSKKLYNINNSFRYSEHYGLLDFNHVGLEKILISGNTTRIDENDDEILMPKDIPDEFDYEYIFHTHPPTPKVGGRANLGILYEVPSISDLFHFIDHFNLGSTQGSIVIAAEGMYIIRKLVFDRKKLKLDEDKFYKDCVQVYELAQHEAIKKYSTNFTSRFFYSKIANDRDCIDKINNVLNKYLLHIDYFPRIKDEKNKYIIDTVYLPIYVIESGKK